MISILKGYDLAELGHNSPAYIHLIAEAMKLSFADRERYYGDPRFVDVPLDALLSEAYAEERRGMIRHDQAWSEMPPFGDMGSQYGAATVAAIAATGSPPAPADTSYCCAIDRDGNVFSATPSDVSWESFRVPAFARPRVVRKAGPYPATLPPLRPASARA
jgi:gamma-glutamyltranspeptidase/glutathione hydrolase